MDDTGPRYFAAAESGAISELGSPEAAEQHMGVSPALSAAYDVLDDAGLASPKRVELLVAAEAAGQAPEAFARHLVKLCRGARPQSPEATRR